MSRYQMFVLACLPVMVLIVTLVWWMEHPRYTWREMWTNMWEAS